MSISSPLPSTAFSTEPLHLTFSLDQILSSPTEPPSSSTLFSSFDSSRAKRHNVGIFEELDRRRIGWSMNTSQQEDSSGEESEEELEDESSDPAHRQGQTGFEYALSDTARLLYPSTNLELEKKLSQIGGGQDEEGEERLPDWLKETSGRVRNITSGYVYKEERIVGDYEDTSRKKKRRKLRVAVGCEDGVLWLFGKRDEVNRHDRDATVTQNGETATKSGRPPQLDSQSQRKPTNSSRPTTPPFSPTSDNGSVTLSPRLHTRHSSASLSTLSSFASQSGRVTSGPPSANGSQSYSEIKSSDHRLRKASATVSVSTTSVTPSSSHAHSHSLSSANNNATPMQNHDDNALPPLSPVSHSPTYPLSPIPSHPPSSTLPQFRFSPSAQSSRNPSPRRHPHGLVSKKETRSSSVSTAATSGSWVPPGSDGGERRTHSRAKDSIASGIGLWETTSVTSTRDVITGETDSADKKGLAIFTEEEARLEENWEDLEPLVRILPAGHGSIVGLLHIDGEELRLDSEGQGDVTVVLRQNGHISILSLTDGRCIGSCYAGGAKKGDFRELQTVKAGETLVAICSAVGDTSFAVSVDLRTLEIIETIEEVDVFTITASSSPSLLYFSPGSHELLRRPIRADLVTPMASKTPSDETRAMSLGSLESWSRSKGLRSKGDLVIAWDETGLSIATLERDQLSQLALIPSKGVSDVQISDVDSNFVVLARGSVRYYEVLSTENRREVKLLDELFLDGLESLYLVQSPKPVDYANTIVARRQVQDRSTLELVTLASSPNLNREIRELYKSKPLPPQDRVTCSHNLDSDSILLGFSDGTISLLPYSSLGRHRFAPKPRARLDGAITLLDVVDVRGNEVIVAGSANGMVGIWNASDWETIATSSLFASPVLSWAKLSLPSHRHALLFISYNSPIAIVSLYPNQVLYTLPGSRSPAQLVATTTEGEVMVLYKQGLARVWDAETGELRRSMQRETAEGVLKEKEKGWQVWFDASQKRCGDIASEVAHPSITLDLRAKLEDIARDLPWAASRRTPKRLNNGFDSLEATPDVSRAGSPAPFAGSANSPLSDQLDIARQWLANLVPFGVDRDCDETLQQLGIVKPSLQLSLASTRADSSTFTSQNLRKSAWTLSPHSTAQRLLLITSVLRVFLNYPSTERSATQAIVHFASCLEDSVGADFECPDLGLLADFWLDKNSEVQQAARSLFGTYLASLPDIDLLKLVEAWQDKLPARQIPQASQATTNKKAETALLVVGLVAVDRFKLLSAIVLKDLATSIASYLDDYENPLHQAIATELCSRGFHIWQNYVDAMSLVRQLFSIAIGRNPSTPSDLRVMARQATVHVASVNSPLFMSTLLFDILNAPTAIARNATLKLLGFMIRKKPLVLHHSLPRVTEAVVKSLDPTVSDLRETVHQTATVILNELVRTFPSIDFHGKSQRLAVGTHEGTSIVYDLKTATRLYVLDGHRRPMTAVSWSPDGHRLATVSLDESKVCVWKTGLGLLSLIGAPTQRAGSPPFKEWDFHAGDEGLMTTGATLEWVVVDWPADRTVRLRLRETALSFGA